MPYRVGVPPGKAILTRPFAITAPSCPELSFQPYQDNRTPKFTPWAQKSSWANGTLGRTLEAAGAVPKLGIRLMSSTGSICPPGRTTFVQYRNVYPPNTATLGDSW